MGGCLDDNTVLAFFEGNLAKAENAAVQRHVDGCAECRVLLAEVARRTRGDSATVPKAKRITFPEPPPGPAAPPAEPSERVVIRDGKVTKQRRSQPKQPIAAPVKRAARAGDVLGGRYRLERLLGEGATGVVWEATHTVIRRSLALKLLKSREDEAVRRFLREARITAALQHPNIVEVSDVFVLADSNAPAMVMELLVGAPLSHWLRVPSPHPLPPRDVARVLLQVVSALSAAHSVGVIHRDLKPENIFIVGEHARLDDPRVKVLDFGLAKLTAMGGDMANTGKLTRTGFIVGTPHYMSPEQIVIGGSVEPSSDVWSLGVILYECLAGVRPIEGATIAHVLRALAPPRIVPLAQRAPHVPPGLAALVMRMLATMPDERPLLGEVYASLVTDAA